MADLKISQLPSSTALVGTEVVPIVQSGATKKATINQLLAPSAGSGIDFSASSHSAGMTSELFNDYEEGQFTTTAVCSSGTITLSAGLLYYTKIGRVVHVTGNIKVLSVVSPTGTLYFTGLPFPAKSVSAPSLHVIRANPLSGMIPVGIVNEIETTLFIQLLEQSTGNLLGAASMFKADTGLTINLTYIA